jgi:antitoxin VapB
MALNIKNPEVEQLAAEIAAIMGESKTEAIRRALQERRHRLAYHTSEKGKTLRLMEFLRNEVWPLVPEEMLDVPLSQEAQDRILGFSDTAGEGIRHVSISATVSLRSCP